MCYNRGCGKTYDPAKNDDNSCFYHTGVPVFHDAYKSWSCCQKKTTDFTEFLNIKGCCNGKHSNEKPKEPEVEKKVATETPKETVIRETEEEKQKKRLPRPPRDIPIVPLQIEITPALKDMIEKKRQEVALNENVDSSKPSGDEIPAGTPCKNKGCRESFPASNSSCIHHPGVPIFHEGMKYWSCCQRKTSDFSMFLAQEGCETGDHVWIEAAANETVQCRYDWHQFGNYVVISIYSKFPQPEDCKVEANPVRVKASITFGDLDPKKRKLFTLDLDLNGIIDVEQSVVKFAPTKTEIKMRKAEPQFSWPKLELPQVRSQSNINEQCDGDNIDNL